MARNTQVAADHDAPPVTRTLAKFVATHPSRGWSDAVDHEAHRTFLNWVGCAVGAARHEAAQAALDAAAMLQPAPQSTVLGRPERVDMASAALMNGITLAPLRLRRHPPEDDHPPRGPGRLGALRAGGSHGSLGPAGDRRAGARHRRLVPARQRDVPGSLRPGLAHHRLDGDARGGRRLRAPAGPGRGEDRHGARHRRLAAGGHARAVRHDDQALPPGRRGARGTAFRAAREARLHRERARPSRRRAATCRSSPPSATGTRPPTSWAGASRSPSTPTSPSPAAS